MDAPCFMAGHTQSRGVENGLQNQRPCGFRGAAGGSPHRDFLQVLIGLHVFWE